MIKTLTEGTHEIILLDNILQDGTYGKIITNFDSYWIQNSNTQQYFYITDDEKMKIFPELNKLYFEYKKKGNDIRLSKAKKYYSYCLLDGEYVLLKFSRTVLHALYEIGEDYKFKKLIIQAELKMGGFLSFNTYHIVDSDNSDYYEPEFLQTKTMYVEDILEKSKWTNYVSKLNDFFKSNGIDNPIDKIKKQLRKDKIKRLIT